MKPLAFFVLFAIIFTINAFTHDLFDEQTTVIGEQVESVFALSLDPKAPRAHTQF